MKSSFSLAEQKEYFIDIVSKADQKTLAVWAVDCAERVLPYFEDSFPNDKRPKQALETLQTWLDTGVFKMSVIRGASLASHAAARDVNKDSSARSAARAAGQAAATAHVPTHAIGSAIYALQAIHRAGGDVAKEREWQHKHLLDLAKK
ncbi:MAG: hypothetical protein Q7S53_03625 [bacterium]|nr:hypothetical protein [bacterium]